MYTDRRMTMYWQLSDAIGDVEQSDNDEALEKRSQALDELADLVKAWGDYLANPLYAELGNLLDQAKAGVFNRAHESIREEANQADYDMIRAIQRNLSHDDERYARAAQEAGERIVHNVREYGAMIAPNEEYYEAFYDLYRAAYGDGAGSEH